MDTDVRTFRAPTMQAALEIVRREMGLDAVILHTRQITLRRFLPWSRPKEEVEITAGLGVNVRPLALRSREEARAESASDSPSPAGAATATEPPKSRRWTSGAGRGHDVAERESVASPRKAAIGNGVELAFSSSAFTRTPPPAAPKPPVTLPAVSPTPAPSTEARLPSAEQRPAPPRREAPDRFAARRSSPPSRKDKEPAAAPRDAANHRDTPAQRAAMPKPADRHSRRERPPVAPKPRAAAPNPNDPALLFAERLDSIERMLEQLGRRVSMPASPDIPAELFDLYTNLIDHDVEDGLARSLVYRVKEHCVPAQLADPLACRNVLTAIIESEIRCAPPIAPVRGRRTVVALVGATGVGKTTTIAKLAANFRLREGIRMGLVTVDTYRIAAVEQLRTYAEIIDLPMRVVTNPREMRQALDELTGLDLVLIDTAGRSPRDEMQIQELKQLLDEADVDQVHLVLSLTASVKSLESTVAKFAPVKTTSVILTKLDEASGLGAVLTLSHTLKTPISYVTTGQDVPDDFEPANAARLARLVIGEDRIARGRLPAPPASGAEGTGVNGVNAAHGPALPATPATPLVTV